MKAQSGISRPDTTVINKHGRYYWLDIWIEGKRVRQSLKTTKHGLALKKAGEISDSPFVSPFVLVAENGGFWLLLAPLLG